MTAHATGKAPLTLLGLGAMGAALAHAWLDAGHPVTVWNRTPGRADAFADKGAVVAASAAEAVAANRLVVTCLLDHASVGDALDGADLAGRDLVDLTTGTPADSRDRAAWAAGRGARFLHGGIMAVPPMIGVPEAGPYVLYSGSPDAFAEHGDVLAVPARAVHVGADAGFAALWDVALLSAMHGMFSGITHAYALLRKEDVPPRDFAPLLADWLVAMAPSAHSMAEQLASGDYAKDVVSNLAMQVAGNATMIRTAEEQGVSTALLTPYADLMARRLADGFGHEDTAGVVDLLIV
ncbi:NAD(P)-dependent oxidoreductase [Streptomyces sp. NPDC060194]|uniref:NAD(P)-dependent oxidoreductase n=1 Tax=Streptomyces sp. NPDC060194 TaxID=3347069 RepID=UPI0036551111